MTINKGICQSFLVHDLMHTLFSAIVVRNRIHFGNYFSKAIFYYAAMKSAITLRTTSKHFVLHQKELCMLHKIST